MRPPRMVDFAAQSHGAEYNLVMEATCHEMIGKCWKSFLPCSVFFFFSFTIFYSFINVGNTTIRGQCIRCSRGTTLAHVADDLQNKGPKGRKKMTLGWPAGKKQNKAGDKRLSCELKSLPEPKRQDNVSSAARRLLERTHAALVFAEQL